VVKPYLLDVNVLIALAWPNHVHHEEAVAWFARKAAAGFRTCPITQSGFVRISSNPAFFPNAVTPAEALALLQHITRMPGHDFWPDDLALPAALSARPLAGHRQVTDAYLLALAVHRGGVLATLDRAAAFLAKDDPDTVEMVFAN
jgi:uncharacterized protein